ncbi:MAG: zinc ribbon domain-containing protein [Defluviitaleaceae bacterium]|nr:zinc ribbon domain-containing protein [Defluviitaleaceae bacterium]
MKFCSACGKELVEGSKFCMGCGAPSDGSGVATTSQEPNAAVAAATAAATTAIGFFKQFIKSPMTAVQSGSINQPEAIIYLALVPISMLLLLNAYILRLASNMDISASRLRDIMDISLGGAVFETIIHVAVWFVILIAVPFGMFKFFGNSEKIDFAKIFPVFAAITLPITVLFILSAVFTLISTSAGIGFLMAASIPLGTVSFWILHTVAVKRTFGGSLEQAVYSSIITYVLASMYSLFGMSRVAGNILGGMMGSLF